MGQFLYSIIEKCVYGPSIRISHEEFDNEKKPYFKEQSINYEREYKNTTCSSV